MVLLTKKADIHLRKNKSDIVNLYRFYFDDNFCFFYLVISLSVIIFHNIYLKSPFLKE